MHTDAEPPVTGSPGHHFSNMRNIHGDSDTLKDLDVHHDTATAVTRLAMAAEPSEQRLYPENHFFASFIYSVIDRKLIQIFSRNSRKEILLLQMRYRTKNIVNHLL